MCNMLKDFIVFSLSHYPFVWLISRIRLFLRPMSYIWFLFMNGLEVYKEILCEKLMDECEKILYGFNSEYLQLPLKMMKL